MTPCQIKSMTGFGRAQRQTAYGQFTVEVRTVNNRYQDISVSLPRELNALEGAVRTLLKERLARGKIDCRVRYTPAAEQQPRVTINQPLALQYIERLRELQEMGVESDIPMQLVTSLPGVVELVPAELDEKQLWEELRAAAEEAVAAVDAEHVREGRALGVQLRELGGRMREARAEVDRLKAAVVERYRERLRARLDELQEEIKVPLDAGRLEMEVALFADKADIAEELVRLEAHLERFDELLRNEDDEPTGRGLDFLVQEFMREINTICSKARDSDLLGPALEMKSIVERIREQIQNIQ